MTRTPQRLGKQIAAHAIGFHGRSYAGAAALPSVTGLIAQYVGLSFVAATFLVMAAALFLFHELLLTTSA
jgi:hypothetical protein